MFHNIRMHQLQRDPLDQDRPELLSPPPLSAVVVEAQRCSGTQMSKKGHRTCKWPKRPPALRLGNRGITSMSAVTA